MSANIKYTEAERRSFKLVPETCPVIEKAFDKAFDPPSLKEAFVTEILAKYTIPYDKNLHMALHEIMNHERFARKQDLLSVVLYEGTFPLRLALVNTIEDKMRADGVDVKENHFSAWLKVHERQKLLRSMREVSVSSGGIEVPSSMEIINGH